MYSTCLQHVQPVKSIARLAIFRKIAFYTFTHSQIALVPESIFIMNAIFLSTHSLLLGDLDTEFVARRITERMQYFNKTQQYRVKRIFLSQG